MKIIISKGTTSSLLILLGAVLLISSLYMAISVTPAEVLTSIQNTESNATVTRQVAISLSANLSAGILFGTVDPNTNNNNATGNFGGAGQTLTQYNISIDSTTNTPIDICIKANQSLTSGSNTIGLGNYTWNASTTNNATLPSYPTPQTALTTAYDTTNKIAANVQSGTYHLRFALDIPAVQAAGTYSNQVSFKGADTATGC